MFKWQDILQLEFLGNPVAHWGFAVLTLLLTLTVLPIVKGLIAARRRSWTPSDRLQFHSAIELTALLAARTSRVFLFAVALYLASRHLTFPPRVERVITIVIVCVFWLQAGLWAMASVRFGIELRRSRSPEMDALLTGSMDVVLFCAGLIIWAMAMLLALDNLGVQIRPLLAGLGIGGIAIALAVQTVLGDVLASMSITLDKPFSVGDSLTIGDYQGTVEHIGVKSTRLRSLSGEQIIIANADIIKARVRNFGRMGDRRAVFEFGVNYDTPTAVLAAIPGEVRKIVEALPDTRFERCHFLTYGDTALQFELVYFMTKSDFGLYADTQQAINLALLDRLREMKVQLAAPTPALVYVELPTGPGHAASGASAASGGTVAGRGAAAGAAAKSG